MTIRREVSVSAQIVEQEVVNNRRKLVIALGAGTLIAPLHSFAQQQGKIWRVGFLAQPPRPDSLDSHIYGGCPQGMRELGYVEGKNLVIEWRFADDRIERLPDLAAELVRLKVDVIVTAATSSARAAQKATVMIPVVASSIQSATGL
jgi:putative ABC transport system substrate-binding protein